MRAGTARLLRAFLAVCAVGALAGAARAETTITIGTGSVTGVYYPAGGAICRLVNRGRKEHGIRCTVESTGGSINNLEAIHKGELELGVVQSDLLYDAYTGSDMFAGAGRDTKIRTVFALHSEPFTVIARASSKIRNFKDLRGKRVYIGAPGSGMRATMEELMKRKGWSARSIQSIDLKSSEQAQALCAGRIDAMVYAGGHPNGTIQQITSQCATRLIDVSGPDIEKLIAEHPFYSHAVIPGGMYAGNARDTRTFGVRAVLVASADLDEAVVYEVVRAVFDNLDNFKTLHPVFATLDADHMVPQGLVAPIHPGALKYFREKGLIP